MGLAIWYVDMKAIRKLLSRFLMSSYEFGMNARAYIPFWSLEIVSRNLKDGQSILDVGCGRGETMRALTKRNRGLITVGIDIHLPYLKKAKDHKTHDQYILCDVRKLPFRRKSFTTVLCVNVIEHLEKQEGENLIKDMEELASKQVVIVTPPYFSKEGSEVHEEPYQIHKSGWSPKEFKEIGCKVMGHAFYGKWQLISGSPQLLKPIIYVACIITSLLTYFLPTIAGEMVCVKLTNGK
jgi:SAM-dependent methyltransferase